MQPAKILSWLFYFSLALLLVALPLSKYVISISEFCLAGVFILDGIRYKEVSEYFQQKSRARIVILFIPTGLKWIFSSIYRKFRDFFHKENAPAWIFSSLYLLHILGLIITVDFDYALKDLRVKFPLILLPLVLSTTGRIDRKAFRILLYLFIASVLTSTFISMHYYITRQVTDIRDISVFMSHIRFGLLIDISIFILIFQILKKNNTPAWGRVLMMVPLVWLIIFLFITASMTGLVIFFITSVIMIFYLVAHKRNLIVKAAILTGVVMAFIFTGYQIYHIGRDVYKVHPVDFDKLDKVTAQGNHYRNDTIDRQVENGYYVWIYLAADELRQAWNHRSSMDYDGKDRAGQDIRYTIIRFLTSKGFRKDAEGVSKLTDEEVALIENGVASTVYLQHSSLYVRIYKIIWEYKRYQITHNPSGHSVMQRIEYWKTAWVIIKENWLTGVGTGDVYQEFEKSYDKTGSLLEKEFRFRSHNQFLTFFVVFGAFGLAWFFVTLLFPALRLRKFPDYYYLTFFIIIVMSMLTEDTIESQAGVTIYAFFSSFYLFSKKFIDII